MLNEGSIINKIEKRYQSNKKKYRADPIAKEKKRLYDLTRVGKRRHKKWADYTEEEKERQRARQRADYIKNKEKINARQKLYRDSEEGRKKELARHSKYRKTEKGKHLNRRITARLKHLRRTLEKEMTPLDVFTFDEAYDVRVRREKLFGFKWHIDHIVPVTKGGTNAYTNIQVVPASWNSKKGNKHTEKYFGDCQCFNYSLKNIIYKQRMKTKFLLDMVEPLGESFMDILHTKQTIKQVIRYQK